MSLSTPEGMYTIEEPLRDGNKLRCFSSGFGLRVARIEAPEGQLVGYGEAPTIDVALVDAAENYHTGESYRRQYRDIRARYPHKIYGSEESVSPLDDHLHRGGKLLARWGHAAVVAGLYTLKHIPDEELLAPLSKEDEDHFPVIVTQFGRVFGINRIGDRLHVAYLPSSDSDTGDPFVCVIRDGTGDTLHEAVEAAFAAKEVEATEDIFH